MGGRKDEKNFFSGTKSDYVSLMNKRKIERSVEMKHRKREINSIMTNGKIRFFSSRGVTGAKIAWRKSDIYIRVEKASG